MKSKIFCFDFKEKKIKEKYIINLYIVLKIYFRFTANKPTIMSEVCECDKAETIYFSISIKLNTYKSKNIITSSRVRVYRVFFRSFFIISLIYTTKIQIIPIVFPRNRKFKICFLFLNLCIINKFIW